MDGEEWRDVVGYEGYYQVSSLGRVRSLDRRIRGRPYYGRVLKGHTVGSGYHDVTLCDRDSIKCSGRGGCPYYGRVLKGHTVGSGYHDVTLCDRDSIKCSQYIHNLVLSAFVGPKPTGLEVNHKDGVKTNNALSNLEYVTKSENNLHRINVLGIQVVRGSQNGIAKLTEEQVIEMRRQYDAGTTSHRKLAKVFGVHYSTVARIVERKSWSWLE